MHERIFYRERVNDSVKPLILHFTVYTVAIFIFTSSLPFLLQDGEIAYFKENGLIEWMQLSCLLTACTIFLIGCMFISQFREIFILLASVCAFAAVRELDSFLDNLIPVIGWKIATVIIVFAAWMAYIHKEKLAKQVPRFLSSPAFVVLWAGFIMAVPVAQLLGHGEFLETLMGDDYNHAYKRVIEESGEVVGYLLIVAGSVESYLKLKKAGN